MAMEQTETLHIDRYRLTSSSCLEAVREGRSSTIDLWLCEGEKKQYLKTVEANQVMLEVTAMRAKR
jgi:hypothetical protein